MVVNMKEISWAKLNMLIPLIVENSTSACDIYLRIFCGFSALYLGNVLLFEHFMYSLLYEKCFCSLAARTTDNTATFVSTVLAKILFTLLKTTGRLVQYYTTFASQRFVMKVSLWAPLQLIKGYADDISLIVFLIDFSNKTRNYQTAPNKKIYSCSVYIFVIHRRPPTRRSNFREKEHTFCYLSFNIYILRVGCALFYVLEVHTLLVMFLFSFLLSCC